MSTKIPGMVHLCHIYYVIAYIWPFTFKNSPCKRSVGHETLAWAVSLSLNKRIKIQKHTKILITYPIQATIATVMRKPGCAAKYDALWVKTSDSRASRDIYYNLNCDSKEPDRLVSEAAVCDLFVRIKDHVAAHTDKSTSHYSK